MTLPPSANAKIVAYWNRRKQGLTRREWEDFYGLVVPLLMRTQLPTEYASSEARKVLIDTFFADKIFLNAETSEAGPLENAFALHGYLKNFALDLHRQDHRHVSLDENLCDEDDEGVALSLEHRHLLAEAGIDLEAAISAADQFVTRLDAGELAYLSLNTCQDDGHDEPISAIAKRMALGSSYHYRARQLGVTGAKGGFFQGYESTKLGQWLVSLGARINQEWREELAVLLTLLCLRMTGWGRNKP